MISAETVIGHQLVINPVLEVIIYSDDEILIKHGSRSAYSRVVRDDGGSKLLGRIVHAFRTTTMGQTLVAAGVVSENEIDELSELLSYLLDEHILVPAADDPTDIYVNTILSSSASLSTFTIGLVGAGFLGIRLAEEFARLHVKELVVLDDRTCQDPAHERPYFSRANGSLQRGSPYHALLKQDLASANFDNVSVVAGGLTDEAALRTLLGKVDFTVVALEHYSPHILHTMNGVAIELRRPWMPVVMDGSEALIGPLFVPGETCCFNEVDIQHTASAIDIRDDYITYRDWLSKGKAQSAAPPPVLSPYLSVASGLGAVGIMRFLATRTSFLIERCVRVDFERLTVDYETIMRLPRCPACTISKPYRHLFL